MQIVKFAVIALQIASTTLLRKAIKYGAVVTYLLALAIEVLLLY